MKEEINYGKIDIKKISKMWSAKFKIWIGNHDKNKIEITIWEKSEKELKTKLNKFLSGENI